MGGMGGFLVAIILMGYYAYISVGYWRFWRGDFEVEYFLRCVVEKTIFTATSGRQPVGNRAAMPQMACGLWLAMSVPVGQRQWC